MGKEQEKLGSGEDRSKGEKELEKGTEVNMCTYCNGVQL